MGLNTPGSLHPPTLAITTMLKGKTFSVPDGDVILRALGPPSHDFRVHKLVLSLASPVFKDVFSLPQPTSGTSSVAEIEIVEVADPPHALDIILRLIYPFTPPSFDGNLDTLVECLIVADKYDIKAAKARLRQALGRSDVADSLRVYAIASRFGFASIVESTSRLILSDVHLPGISELPDDFKFIPATAYHKLVRHHTIYLEAVVEIIEQTPLKSKCSNCPGWKSSAEELFRLRLANLIIMGTPVEVHACFGAWVKAYGHNADCEGDCVLKFIYLAVSRVDNGFFKPGASPPQKKAVVQKKVTLQKRA